MNITTWSAVSPYGLGREAFATGMMARRRTAVELDPGQWQVPDPRACLVPQFDPSSALGRKGTRTMNRVTGLAVAAVGELPIGAGGGATEDEEAVDDEGNAFGDGALSADASSVSFSGKPSTFTLPKQTPAGHITALVLGTTTGSAQSMMDFTRASLTGERPFDVEPGAIPNSVMNCAAAQCAIWHHIQGPNTTLACGRPSGLLALAYARRLLLGGRANAVLCGGAEEYSPARSWLEHHTRDGAPALLGEGAAILRVELGGGPDTLASVLAVASRVCLPGADLAELVTDTVRTALERAGVAARHVWAAAPSGLSGDESEALGAMFGPEALDRVPPTAELLGDTGAASAAFQLAATLTAGADAPGRIAVVTSVDVDGVVAAAVLRLGGLA